MFTNTPARDRSFLLSLCLAAALGSGCTTFLGSSSAGFKGDTTEIFGSGPKTSVETERINQPPPGKALVNFHFPKDAMLNTLDSLDALFDTDAEARESEKKSTLSAGEVAIFDGSSQLLIYLPQDCVFQHVCDPGEQVFMAWRGPRSRATVVKADLLPDEIYDILVGKTAAGLTYDNASLIPMAKENPKRAKLAKYEVRAILPVALNSSSPRVANLEAQMAGQIEKTQTDLLNGKTNRVLYLHPDDHR